MTNTFELPAFVAEACAAAKAHSANPNFGLVRPHFNLNEQGEVDGTWVLVPFIAHVPDDAILGRGTHIGLSVLLGGTVRIGDGTCIGDGAHVNNGVIIGSRVRIGDGACTSADAVMNSTAYVNGQVDSVIIDSRVRIGNNVLINAGVYINTGAIVPPGTNVPEWHIFHKDGTTTLRNDAPEEVKAKFTAA